MFDQTAPATDRPTRLSALCADLLNMADAYEGMALREYHRYSHWSRLATEFRRMAEQVYRVMVLHDFPIPATLVSRFCPPTPPTLTQPCRS